MKKSFLRSISFHAFLKPIAFALPLLCLAQAGWCLEVKVDKYDSTVYGEAASFSVISATKNVVYLRQCTRDKLKLYEWTIWEGNFEVEATVQPIATITVKKEKKEALQSDTIPFIMKAIQSSADIGGDIVCQVAIRKAPHELGLENIVFRTYKQFFRSGHPGLVTYYNERIGEGQPLTLGEIRSEIRGERK